MRRLIVGLAVLLLVVEDLGQAEECRITDVQHTVGTNVTRHTDIDSVFNYVLPYMESIGIDASPNYFEDRRTRRFSYVRARVADRNTVAVGSKTNVFFAGTVPVSGLGDSSLGEYVVKCLWDVHNPSGKDYEILVSIEFNGRIRQAVRQDIILGNNTLQKRTYGSVDWELLDSQGNPVFPRERAVDYDVLVNDANGQFGFAWDSQTTTLTRDHYGPREFPGAEDFYVYDTYATTSVDTTLGLDAAFKRLSSRLDLTTFTSMSHGFGGHDYPPLYSVDDADFAETLTFSLSSLTPGVTIQLIPEPSTLAGLLSLGIVGLIGYWYRRRRA